MSCLARAVARHPIVQGYLYRGRVVVFDDVDAVAGQRVDPGDNVLGAVVDRGRTQ